jgi:hypothetical protein
LGSLVAPDPEEGLVETGEQVDGDHMCSMGVMWQGGSPRKPCR